jgi:nucleotide-binding universal stress UspA family protein
MYDKILVATDGSSLSKHAVRSAIDLAAAVGAKLVVLHVVPNYPLSYFEGALTMNAEDISRTEKRWHDHGRTVVDTVVQAAQKAGVQGEGVVMRSDQVGETIVAAAGKHHCDLVMMASHGRRGIERLLLGSETQYVLTHCKLPVLVLR